MALGSQDVKDMSRAETTGCLDSIDDFTTLCISLVCRNDYSSLHAHCEIPINEQSVYIIEWYRGSFGGECLPVAGACNKSEHFS